MEQCSWHGVVIGVVDDGLEWDHDDLKTNYESTLDYDYCNYDGNPEPAGWDAHGTAAAGVAAATGNNGLGVSGAAPDASLAGLMLIACGNSDSDEANALSHSMMTLTSTAIVGVLLIMVEHYQVRVL